MSRLVVGGVLFCFALVYSGCDMLEETIFLDRTAVFSFEFAGEAISPDGAVSDNTPEDFDQRLDGFHKEEIIAATIVTARLERDFPARNLDQIFSSLTLVLERENGQDLTVATQSAMPNQRHTALDILSENITAFVRAPDGFYGRIEVEAAENIDPQDLYGITVELEISFEIEGI